MTNLNTVLINGSLRDFVTQKGVSHALTIMAILNECLSWKLSKVRFGCSCILNSIM